MAEDRIVSMKIAKLMQHLVRDKRTNSAALASLSVDALATSPPRPAQG